MEQIELNIDGKKALYHSETRVVTFCTRNGVMMENEVPKDWALTRIFQFMVSLVKADSVII
jgi:hypothetical protein